ncbi:MAG: aryldialkylphosphatase [Arthrobacter sp.]|jgi:predicted metal-dependent phosphotriesterase family hydrolase|nr:aryldialkylphosphatase [Arthrobacter sp.]
MAQFVQTVLGPIDPAKLGKILHHEHLTSLVPGPWLSGGRPEKLADPQELVVSPCDPAYFEDQVAQAVGALSGLKALGFDTVVDLSPYSVVGRTAFAENLPILQRVSERSGVHIVAGSSVYLEPYSPPWTAVASLEEMTERFTLDVTAGIGSTSIKAGILGEQATGLDEITAHEEKCLRAAARAHKNTGVALTTHTTHGTMALEQIGMLKEEGADLGRVVIGHMDIQPEFDYLLRVLDTGVNIAFDTIGKEFWDFVLEPGPAQPAEGEFSKRAYYRSDASRAKHLAELARRGYAGQLFLSQDLTGPEVYLNPGTHGEWGYNYLGAVFIPMAAEQGLSQADADVMLRDNPLRLLTQETL